MGRTCARLDQDVLLVIALVGGGKDVRAATGLARPCVSRIEVFRPNRPTDEHGEDDERQPPEDGGLPVRGAPASRTRCDVALSSHSRSIRFCEAISAGADPRLRVRLAVCSAPPRLSTINCR